MFCGKKRVAKRISGEKIVVVKQRLQFSKKTTKSLAKRQQGTNSLAISELSSTFPDP